MTDDTNFSGASAAWRLLIANCFKIDLYLFEIGMGEMVVLEWWVASALKVSAGL